MGLIYYTFVSVVCEGSMFSSYPSAAFVHTFVCLSRRILLPRYLINGLSNLFETSGEYSLAPTDNPIRFWRLKVNLTECHRDGDGVHLDTGCV